MNYNPVREVTVLVARESGRVRAAMNSVMEGAAQSGQAAGQEQPSNSNGRQTLKSNGRTPMRVLPAPGERKTKAKRRVAFELAPSQKFANFD